MNKELTEAIALEQTLHPLCEAMDLLKLLVQSCFGAVHLQMDETVSLQMLEEEKVQAEAASSTVQYIGNGLCRVPLSYMKSQHLPLWNLMFLSTMKHTKQNQKEFDEAVSTLCESYVIPDQLIAKATQGVHHSESYRKVYQPHYRIMKQAYVQYFEVIVYVWEKMRHSKSHIGIDGRCASGKSTLSQLIEEIFHIQVLHLDDYFLPVSVRCKDRMNEIGGNIDYDRFQKEILEPLEKQETMYLRRYDCQNDTLCEPIEIPYQRCTIWEGSYAHHPNFRQALNASIFVSCDMQTQRLRLKKRSPKLYERFIKEWIPMEEAYFEAFQIREQSDILLDTSNF